MKKDHTALPLRKSEGRRGARRREDLESSVTTGGSRGLMSSLIFSVLLCFRLAVPELFRGATSPEKSRSKLRIYARACLGGSFVPEPPTGRGGILAGASEKTRKWEMGQGMFRGAHQTINCSRVSVHLCARCHETFRLRLSSLHPPNRRSLTKQPNRIGKKYIVVDYHNIYLFNSLPPTTSLLLFSFLRQSQ